MLGFLVPGEGPWPSSAGSSPARGSCRLSWRWPWCAAAAIGGNLAGYYLGRRLHGPWILRHGGRFGVRAEHFQRVEQFFSRHGGKTVLLGRLSPVLRALVPFVAGASRLLRSFVFYTVLGGLLWAAATVTLGYLAGASWQYVEHWLGGLATLALAAVVLGVLLLWTCAAASAESRRSGTPCLTIVRNRDRRPSPDIGPPPRQHRGKLSQRAEDCQRHTNGANVNGDPRQLQAFVPRVEVLRHATR